MPKFTSLDGAISNGTVDDVKFFIEEKGEKIEPESRSFFSASPEVLEYLFSKGLKVNEKIFAGDTLLHTAAQTSGVESIKYLISKGSKINAKNDVGETPLHLAASLNPDIEVLECLIANGADVNAKEIHNLIPLFFALQNNQKEDIIEILVAKGSNVHEKSKFGFSVFDYAKKQGKEHLLVTKKEKKDGCFIATCVYGSYDSPEVCVLRRYRDDSLLPNWFGSLFVRVYYAVSPRLVALFGSTKWFKSFSKSILDFMVKRLRNKEL